MNRQVVKEAQEAEDPPRLRNSGRARVGRACL
jgi:hypothetical protein